MKRCGFVVIITLIVSFLCGALPAYPGQAAKKEPAGGNGRLELECNIAGVDLRACPFDHFERKEIRRFFGLFKSYHESCSGNELFLGTTPLKPIELPEGRYVLITPSDYAWEHEGPIEVSVTAGRKTFFQLKLFKRYRAQGDGDGGAGGSSAGGSSGGGSSGGGSGTGGGVGSSP
jgi:uncharacterized membrane protein YgcG